MKSDPLLIETLTTIKNEYENSIRSGGNSKKVSHIRSQKLIQQIHDYVKIMLKDHGIDPNKIHPPITKTKPETRMCGLLNMKKQDICVLPKSPKKCIIKEGVLLGNTDNISKDIMDISLSINVRSQLSSIGKNFTTLFERTYAEALNLHLRSPMLVTGDVYMVPLFAYDTKAADNKRVEWKKRRFSLEKYIPSFRYINNRTSSSDVPYKYERISLLIVDFRADPPLEINSTKYLLDEGLIKPEQEDQLSLDGLTISDFVPDILRIYEDRHGSLEPLQATTISLSREEEKKEAI